VDLTVGDFELIAIGLVVFLLAGTIKGVVGVGLPTAGVGLMSQFTDPRTAITMVLLPMVVTNVWQIYRAGNFAQTLRDYWLFGLALAVVIWITSQLSVDIPERILLFITGAVIISFVLAGLIKSVPRVPKGRDPAVQIGIGSVAGILGGLTGIWAAPIALYLLSRQALKEEFVRVTGFLLLIGSVPLALSYTVDGHLNQTMFVISAAMLVPTLAGFTFGESLRRGLSQQRFQQVLLVFFLVMGLNLIRKALL
jgi:uncharacterized membrane protein YfcA